MILQRIDAYQIFFPDIPFPAASDTPFLAAEPPLQLSSAHLALVQLVCTSQASQHAKSLSVLLPAHWLLATHNISSVTREGAGWQMPPDIF
jgi:hypothetical protein